MVKSGPGDVKPQILWKQKVGMLSGLLVYSTALYFIPTIWIHYPNHI